MRNTIINRTTTDLRGDKQVYMKMESLIIREYKASQKYMLKAIKVTAKDKGLVRITANNVARAEAMFRTDSSYANSINPSIDTSSAHTIMRLKRFLDEGRRNREEYKELIRIIVERIDNENSTHLNSDGIGRDVITERISRIPKKKLIEYLRYPEKTHFKLISIIARKTEPKNKKYRGKRNLSFASKFCHYLCLFLFEGETEQDNYPIYDSVIKRNLPKYVKYYGLEERDLDDYAEYRETIDEVIAASGGGISRNGFDHLLWYYHK